MSYDLTPLEHVGIALGMQVVIGLLTGNWWAGAAYGIGWFMGREHSQAEDRWIGRYGKGKRINMPFFGGFDYRVWDINSFLDWFLVLIACVSTGFIVMYWWPDIRITWESINGWYNNHAHY